MRIVVAVILSLLLASCSSKFAYNNLDWWVYWYLDDYIELNDRQEEQFDDYLNNWLSWHKRSELTRYKAHLEQVKQQVVEDKLNYETLLKHLESAKSHWERVRDEVSPELAIMAKELSDEQVVTLFAALEKDNKEEENEREEELKKTEQARLEKRIERIEEMVEERIGDLTKDQKQIVSTYSTQYISTSGDWLKYRRDIQNAARRLFVTRSSNTNFADELIYLMQHPEDYRSEAYQQASTQNTKVMATMLSEIISVLTAKQKSTLIEHIDELIETVSRFQQ